jgi:3-hydroxyisobutyrate dehydrogenase-like beta-hydroxyacid dehydrogenase
MLIQTVGILSPGDMGQAIAAVLTQNGLRVVAALDDRSERTRQLADKAKIEDLGSLDRLVAESDVLLSVLIPSAATQAAEQVALAIRNVGKNLLYVDCNAIAPDKAETLGQLIQDAGGQFVDAAIVGSPPEVPDCTRIYASGTQAGELEQLRDYGLDIRVIGDEIGQASGLKMCYAALTKGLSAIAMELLVAAFRLDVEEVLWSELSSSQKELITWLTNSISSMPPKTQRWVAEMEEIAATFVTVGLIGRTLL